MLHSKLHTLQDICIDNQNQHVQDVRDFGEKLENIQMSVDSK